MKEKMDILFKRPKDIVRPTMVVAFSGTVRNLGAKLAEFKDVIKSVEGVENYAKENRSN